MDSANSAYRASMPVIEAPRGAAISARADLRHPLALPVIAAGVAGTIAAGVIIFLPDWRLERIAWDLYLDKITDAARPPLGLKARFIMALAAGVSAAGLTGLLAFFTARFSGRTLGGKTMGLSLPNWKFWERSIKDKEEVAATPHVRRRDFHPDAPTPRPVIAHEELGAPLPAVAGSPLAQKGGARIAAAMPEAGQVDWSAPDDVLDLGTALSLTQEEHGAMPATQAVPGAAASSAPVSATGIEFPKWAYEEGQRMAQEDPEYAANAVELARRIHLPSTPEDMPTLPPEVEAALSDHAMPAAAMPDLDMPQYPVAEPEPTYAPVPEAAEINFQYGTNLDAKLSDYDPAAIDTVEPVYTAMHDAMLAGFEPQAALQSVVTAPMVAPMDADASIDAMIDRLERALAMRSQADAVASSDAPSPASAEEQSNDHALDATLSTLARMNRQAYG